MPNRPFDQSGLAQTAIFLVAISLPWCALAEIKNPSEPYISYTVKAGDTLQGVSTHLLTEPKRWGELARLNGLKNPNRIYPQQVLDVPRSLLNFDKQPKLAAGGVLQSAFGSVLVNGAPAQAGSAVPEGAKVQTTQASSAVLKLSDGSTVQLMPSSLAQVVSSHGYAMKDPTSSISTTWFSGAIRLVNGMLDVAANKLAARKDPINVITPTSNIGVRGTQFRVAYEDPITRAARTEVLAGQVRADQVTQGVGANVAGGYGVSIKPGDREVNAVALLPALAQDALPDRVQRARQSRVATWAVGSLAGAAAYRAELAQDAAFTQIMMDIKSPSAAIDLSAAPNGSYYARVRGIDANGIEGYNAARAIVIGDAPTSLIWIREINVAATANYTPEGLLLRVNTASSDAPRNLQVQVARDAGFSQGVQTLAVAADSSILIPGLKAAERYFVRFSGTNAQGALETSPILALELPANWGSTVLGMTSALQPVR